MTVTNPEFQLVAETLQYLEDHFRSQPTLDQLSAGVGVSKFHLQRTFTKWAGVSPKRFLQFLTLENAKERLLNSEPVLAAAFDSGLSGPSRLHDLFVTAEGVTPGEYKRGGSRLTIRYGVQATPFGPALLGFTGRGICHLRFLTDADEKAIHRAVADLEEEWPDAALVSDDASAEHLVSTIFPDSREIGGPKHLSLLLKGTNFQIKVWTALLRIPPGSLVSYGRLASLMGETGSARAVGAAVGRNPIAYLIPCHRVIRAMGAFGQYRWGAARKRAMVGWEAARFRGRERTLET